MLHSFPRRRLRTFGTLQFPVSALNFWSFSNIMFHWALCGSHSNPIASSRPIRSGVILPPPYSWKRDERESGECRTFETNSTYFIQTTTYPCLERPNTRPVDSVPTFLGDGFRCSIEQRWLYCVFPVVTKAKNEKTRSFTRTIHPCPPFLALSPQLQVVPCIPAIL